METLERVLRRHLYDKLVLSPIFYAFLLHEKHHAPVMYVCRTHELSIPPPSLVYLSFTREEWYPQRVLLQGQKLLRYKLIFALKMGCSFLRE